ncbi:MAG: hypothetical protein NT040_10495 [Bacteroidetes bacterium]|nr:hypothetical protein [Bacteroidota bacterium]
MKISHLFFLIPVTFLMTVFPSCSERNAGDLSAGIFGLKPRISDIYTRSSEYQDKEVTIKGKVENSESILGYSGFRVNDGTGKLLVVGAEISPAEGEEITIRGKISIPVRIGGKALIMLKARDKNTKD